MKLTQGENSKLISEGIITLLCLSFLIVGTVLLGSFFTNNELDNQQQIQEANTNLQNTNRRDAKELKFLRQHQKSIETMWSTLKNWGAGITAQDLSPFDQVGLINKIPIPPSKIASNSVEYGGLKVFGSKTEFQRLVGAVAEAENRSGLMQIKSAILQLPPTTLPGSMRPSYLEVQMEILGPLSQ